MDYVFFRKSFYLFVFKWEGIEIEIRGGFADKKKAKEMHPARGARSLIFERRPIQGRLRRLWL